MNNLPTIKDVWSFLKDYKKIIIGTMLACLVLYGLAMTYSIYSSSKIENSERVPVDENVDPSQEVLSTEEIKELQEDMVSFSFYIENAAAEQFTNYNLMKQLLISPETLDYVEEKTGIKIKPSPYHAVNMSLDHSTYVLTLSIGTGNANDNKTIADAYYDGIVNGEIPFFNSNKKVYMVTSPAVVDTEEILPANGESTNEQNEDISITTILALAIVVLIGSFVLGVLVALIYAASRKVITEPFSYEVQEDDTILNLSPILMNGDEKTNSNTIVHAISHPKKKVKLILSEHTLPDDIVDKLSDSFSSLHEYSESTSNTTSTYISILNDLTDVNPTLPIEEVVIISEKNKTTKEWYSRQRLLLKNYQVDVKVIQI